jgi:hypothetical protein
MILLNPVTNRMPLRYSTQSSLSLKIKHNSQQHSKLKTAFLLQIVFEHDRQEPYGIILGHSASHWGKFVSAMS